MSSFTRGEPAAPPLWIPPARRAAIRRRLLSWYDRHRRDLPWRRRAEDPYAQWVAEVMLQQTRVDTVAPYYERFLRRFPTVGSLARARHETVLKHWEGLGYYRRALNLHRASRIVRASKNGKVPNSIEQLRRLPGVGEYTAAAVASIAFSEPIAAVDGNVRRVLSRLFDLRRNDDATIERNRIQSIAQQLVPPDRPGDFNQAWMDLGSLICTPKNPKCAECPLAPLCPVARSDRASSLPVGNGDGRRAIRQVTLVVAVLVREGRMLLCRRAIGGLWSGLWEFPNEEVIPDMRRDQGGPQHVRRIAKREGLRLDQRPKPIGIVEHRLTHRALVFRVYVCRVAPNGAVGDGCRGASRTAARRWVNRRGFERRAVSTAHRRIFAAGQDALPALLSPCDA